MIPVIKLDVVFAATLTGLILHYLWYNILFPTPDLKYPKIKKILLLFLASFFTSFILAHIVQFTLTNDVKSSFITSFWLWVGFYLTNLIFQKVKYGHKRKAYITDAIFYFIQLFLMALILAYWGY